MIASQADVYLVTQEPAMASAVSLALSVNGEWSERSVCSKLSALAGLLQRTPRAAVLVDIDPAPEQMLSELDLTTRRFAETRFIVVSSIFTSDLLLQAMQAGARHFMLKTAVPAELMNVVRRLAAGQSRMSVRRGSAVAFLSAGGGCGATTLAINLAAELHRLSSELVLMMDLDEHYGGLGAYLGVKGQYGIGDVLSHPGHIDPDLITSTARAYNSGLHVLLNSAGTPSAAAGSPDLAGIPAMLDAAQAAYGYSVIDAPRVPIATAVDLAKKCLLTIIVFQLNVRDLRFARILRSALSGGGVPGEDVMLLANRHRSRHAFITLEEARTCLATDSVTTIENDYKNALRGSDYGKLLADVAPRSAIRKGMQKLAEQVIAVHSAKPAS